MAKARSYKFAIEWMADNDDNTWLDEEEAVSSVTACIVADIYGKSVAQVADDLRDAIVELDRRRNADHIDGYDRDDLGESPDH